MQAVVHTNLLGALLCTRAALHLMSKQEGGGHVFNMDGAGADGTATPNYAAYGATKAGADSCCACGSERHSAETYIKMPVNAYDGDSCEIDRKRLPPSCVSM